MKMPQPPISNSSPGFLLAGDHWKHTGVRQMSWIWPMSLQERHNERYGVSNHRHPDCLVSRLFRRTSTKTSKLRVTGLCEWNPPVTAHSPHKGPVMRKKFPFDNVIAKYGMRFWSPEWLHQTALFHQQEGLYKSTKSDDALWQVH